MNFFKEMFCKKDINKLNELKKENNELLKSIEELEKAKVNTLIAEPIFYDTPVKINFSDIKSIVGDGNSMTLLDVYSYGIDKEDVKRIIDKNPSIKNMTYIANDLDCDDFAIDLYGLFNQQTLGRFCFGLARSKGHAFNFFIDRDKKLWIVEPQLGTIMTPYESSIQALDYKITQYII